MSPLEQSRLELVHELAQWRVTLTSGELLTVGAHAFSHEGDFYVFTALMEGNPCFEVEIARCPSSIVDRVEGG